MKNKFLIGKSGLFILLIATLFSCTKKFDKINTDPNKILYVAPDQLMPSALLGALNVNMMRNRNFNNELMQVTVSPSDGDGAVFRYDFRATWADYLWNNHYLELTNFKDMYRDSASTNKSYKGISLICQAWLFSILTDTYGDIPFSDAIKGRPGYGGITEAKFDSQQDVYKGMFDMLTEANTLLAANESINRNADPVYRGNISNWRKFGNALFLRLLLRISGKAEMQATVTSKFKEIVETNATNYPVFTNVNESAVLKWVGPSPFTSPYISIREQDFRSPGLASFFIDNLVAWQDPRLNISIYGKGGVNRWGIAQGSGGFAGINSGYTPGDPNAIKQSYFYSMTQPNNNLQTDSLTGQMMNYAELNFILAEAALKGWISGSPETYYNKGAEASIQLWLPDWPKEAGVNIVSYLTDADMQWIDSWSFDEKMELIHQQKYYALFCNDLQQWFEYRRTGYPVLPKGAGLKNGGIMPARMNYPVFVQSTNPTNYKNAIAAQGPDVMSTQVWWQKP